MSEPLYRLLASAVQARLNCQAHMDTHAEWFARHTERIEQIARDLLPSGSGIDDGTTVDLERSTGERLVLTTAFHHMNDSGMYAGWTDHTVIVRASLVCGITVDVKGRNRNNIKEYLGDTFHEALTQTGEETYTKETEEYAYTVKA